LIWLFLILVISILVLDTPPLIKARAYNELIVFSVILLVGIYLAMVQLYNLPFFNILGE